MKPALFLALLLPALVHADPPRIHTDRQNPRLLPLPKNEGSFHFIVFGDRTGGPPQGVKVLAQAVEDTNLLDPDLVMTVGDLVQGYNAQQEWMIQMQEYRGTMAALRMPWFPVAGNHDIYWRGEGKPALEHEQNYEKHFGPLWYWFEHKNCGFLVLFSDEGDPATPGKPRDFGDPAQQRFSDTQLAWLKQSLEAMKPLQHVFVFMHHPRWAADVYPGNNWDKVHQLLVANGNVNACFAGHIHRLRYDGVKDGIEYFALGATGGHIPGEYPDIGYLHHFNVVTVRPDGIKVGVLPVGSTMDPKVFTPERYRDIARVQAMNPRPVPGAVQLDAGGKCGCAYGLELTNPSQRPVEITMSVADSHGWAITPDHRHLRLEPGAAQTVTFALEHATASGLADFKAPVLALDIDYLEENARATLPTRELPVRLAFGELPAETFAPADPPVALHVSGPASGVKIESSAFELPDGPFTLEAWVKAEKLQRNAGIVAKTEGSEFGFHVTDGLVAFLVHLGDRYASVQSPVALKPGAWTHLAGVHDGESVALYLDGKQVGKIPAAGLRTRNKLPLYLGADPDQNGNPSRPFAGSLDEVRLSKGAVYGAGFTPARRLEPTENTVLLFHADRWIAGMLPDHSASRAHGEVVGEVTLKPATR